MYNSRVWPSPTLYGVGHFTDLRLYYEALHIAKQYDRFSTTTLQKELPERVKGLVFVEGFQKTTFQDLIRELLHFGYIEKIENLYRITDKGGNYLTLMSTDKQSAMDELLDKTQKVFVTPAWFIDRLWTLNPRGQGQVVVPAPVKEWKANKWTDELEDVCKKTYNMVNNALPGSFPIDEKSWLEQLKIEFERKGGLLPPKSVDVTDINNVVYNPRARLSVVMKDVSVKALFSITTPNSDHREFTNIRSQMSHRSFMIWCPRLESFGLLFYTDYKKEIPGRLLFTTSVYKSKTIVDNFSPKYFLTRLNGDCLHLHTPTWESMGKMFVDTLLEVYDVFYNREGIMYISLQDIRDEMCRVLRITPATFESFIQTTYEYSLKRKIAYTISLETDMRQDMKKQLKRKGVYINGILNTLIAIKPYTI